MASGDENDLDTYYACFSMCKPGYKKNRDGRIFYVSCCTSDNCNKELTEKQIQDILQGNVSMNGGHRIAISFSLFISLILLII